MSGEGEGNGRNAGGGRGAGDEDDDDSDGGGATGRRWRLSRVRRDGVESIPVWNLPLADGRLFWEIAGAPFVEAMRLRGVADVLIARDIAAAVADAAVRLHARHHFERIWITGGLTRMPGFDTAVISALADAPFKPRLSEAGAFAGEAGGRDVLAAFDQPGGVVADVGQTSIKVSVLHAPAAPGTPPAPPAPAYRILRARHLDELPRRFIGAAQVTPAGARAVVEHAAPWIAEAVLDALEAAAPLSVPPALVLALPCPIADDLTLGACTYGWERDASLVPRIATALDQAGAFEGAMRVSVLVLNDAELAALSAPSGALTLALTLGFGPGAALVQL